MICFVGGTINLRCLNCGYILLPEQKRCPECGQRFDSHDPNSYSISEKPISGWAKFLVDISPKLTWITCVIAILLVSWGSRLPGANEYLIRYPFDFIFGLMYALAARTIDLIDFSELVWGQIFTLATFTFSIGGILSIIYMYNLTGSSKSVRFTSIAKLLIPVIILTFTWMLSIFGIPRALCIKLSEKEFNKLSLKSQRIGQWYGCYKVSGTDIVDNQIFIYIVGAGFMDDSGSSGISCGFTKDESGDWMSKCIQP